MKRRHYGYKVMRAEAETDADKDKGDNTFQIVGWVLAWCIVVLLFPFSLCFCLYVAREYQRIVIFRLGRLRDSFGPGLVFVLPCIEATEIVDIRTDVANVDPQDVLTKDSVTISVSGVIYYCIFHPVNAIVKVEDVIDSTERIAQVTLRNIVGSMPLNVLLTSRQALSREIQQAVAGITAEWGVRVERVDIMEISLPSELERSLASEAEAEREARAKIILAEGEAKASKALKEASDVMSLNQITLQLRHLQILSSLATEKRVHVIFPIPLSIMEPFLDQKDLSQPEPDGDDQKDGNEDDLSGYFTPKLYIEGSDKFYDPKDEDEPSTATGPATVFGPGLSWKLATFFKRKQEAEDNRPWTSAQSGQAPIKPSASAQTGPTSIRSWFSAQSGQASVKPSSSAQKGQAPSKQSKRAAANEPYPLLPSTLERPNSPSSSQGLPPIPPHPTLPPIPNRPPSPPTPPPKPSSSSESKSKSNHKADENYYF